MFEGRHKVAGREGEKVLKNREVGSQRGRGGQQQQQQQQQQSQRRTLWCVTALCVRLRAIALFKKCRRVARFKQRVP
jgi:hypothetical protein